MRVKVKAKTHEHFPSHQEVPFFLLICLSVKMPEPYKEETSCTDADVFMFCFHVLSKLINGLGEKAPLVLKQLSNSISLKFCKNSECKMARGQGEKSDPDGCQMGAS